MTKPKFLSIIFKSHLGAAFVYFYDDAKSSWSQVTKLAASDSQYYYYFGKAVAVYDNIIVVGTPQDSGNFEVNSRAGKLLKNSFSTACNFATSCKYEGAVYVFCTSTNGSSGWKQQIKLVASDNGNSGHQFGWSVSIYGTVIVGGVSDEDFNANLFQGIFLHYY